jgi:hypothetical protein
MDHDICYDTCGNVKASCDQTFIAAMKAVCDSTFPKALQTIDRLACEALTSQVGRLAIGSSFGVKAYNSAQMEACLCCP